MRILFEGITDNAAVISCTFFLVGIPVCANSVVVVVVFVDAFCRDVVTIAILDIVRTVNSVRTV